MSARKKQKVRDDQKVFKEEDKVEILEKKVNAMQDSLDKILDKLMGT